MKLEEIQILKNIPTKGSLFVVGETDFRAGGNQFLFFNFQRLLKVFFRLLEKYFSTKSFIPAGGNGFSV